MQKERAVTAYFESEQLLLFVWNYIIGPRLVETSPGWSDNANDARTR